MAAPNGLAPSGRVRSHDEPRPPPKKRAKTKAVTKDVLIENVRVMGDLVANLQQQLDALKAPPPPTPTPQLSMMPPPSQAPAPSPRPVYRHVHIPSQQFVEQDWVPSSAQPPNWAGVPPSTRPPVPSQPDWGRSRAAYPVQNNVQFAPQSTLPTGSQASQYGGSQAGQGGHSGYGGHGGHGGQGGYSQHTSVYGNTQFNFYRH